MSNSIMNVIFGPDLKNGCKQLFMSLTQIELFSY